MMPGIDGLQVLEELKKQDDNLPVLMITAFASMDTAIKAMKLGAFDYITKPFKNDEVLVVLRNAIEHRRLRDENTQLRSDAARRLHKFSGIIGRSTRMIQVFELIAQAAPSRSTILITGESGTGKELVARAIHVNSARSDRFATNALSERAELTWMARATSSLPVPLSPDGIDRLARPARSARTPGSCASADDAGELVQTAGGIAAKLVFS